MSESRFEPFCRHELLELIHASECEHDAIVARLGFDPYRLPRYEEPAKSADRIDIDHANEAGSRASVLRGVLDRLDVRRSEATRKENV